MAPKINNISKKHREEQKITIFSMCLNDSSPRLSSIVQVKNIYEIKDY